jgi:hypothetical protein
MTATWSIPIDRLAEKAKADIDTVTRKVTLDLFSAVARRSPVDTGRFRANWNVSLSSPDTTVTFNTNQGRITAEVGKAASFQSGSVVYMVNALPYARRLEYGWSKQAPQGMVRLTVQEFKQYVERAVK